MSKRNITCISCPIGCALTVEWEEGGETQVTGNKCPRGEVYGKEEVLAPKRVVTATVSSTSASFPRVPVRTDGAIGREHIADLLADLNRMRLDLPVSCGQKIVANYRETGIDVVVTRSLSGD